jgi:hypothetical protein
MTSHLAENKNKTKRNNKMEDPKILRKAAKDFALEAYQKMKNNRAYALTPQAKVLLGSLARAMFLRRQAEGRSDMNPKQQSAHQEFFGIIEALSKAGYNVLQARATDPKPLPALWRNPLNNQPLPPPNGIAERSLLQKLDPELLRLFDALEKEPYQVVQQMRSEEAKRQAMAAIEYDSNTHEGNPFRRGEQTEMAELFKRDPTLAQFCQAEAKDVELNLFGSTRDLTARGRLLKDPKTGAIFELAEKIHEQWRMEDKIAAAQAKAAAEATLKQLATQDEVQPERIAQRARVGAE